MTVIDITSINDSERQVIVMDGLTPRFVGPESHARDKYPEAFSDRRPGQFPAAWQTPPESPLATAAAFVCGSAL